MKRQKTIFSISNFLKIVKQIFNISWKNGTFLVYCIACNKVVFLKKIPCNRCGSNGLSGLNGLNCLNGLNQ